MLIRIDLEAVMATAQRNAQVNNVVEDTTARMDNLIAHLNEVWDGGASEQALDSFRDLRRKAAELGEANRENNDVIMRFADAFKALDEAMPVGIKIPVSSWVTKIPGMDLGWGKLPRLILQMIQTVRVIPEEVRAIAGEVKEIAQVYEATAMDLRDRKNELMNSWEGRSAQRYANDTEELVRGFLGMAESLDEFAQKLFVSADRYEELDESLM